MDVGNSRLWYGTPGPLRQRGIKQTHVSQPHGKHSGNRGHTRPHNTSNMFKNLSQIKTTCIQVENVQKVQDTHQYETESRQIDELQDQLHTANRNPPTCAEADQNIEATIRKTAQNENGSVSDIAIPKRPEHGYGDLNPNLPTPF